MMCTHVQYNLVTKISQIKCNDFKNLSAYRYLLIIKKSLEHLGIMLYYDDDNCLRQTLISLSLCKKTQKISNFP